MSSGEDALMETYRSAVAAWECDVMGHMTIDYYFDAFGDAAFDLIERVAPAKAPAAAAWRSASLLVRYEKELRAGDGFFIRSGIIGKDDDAIRIGHEVSKADTREVCTLAEHTLAPREVPYGGLAEQRRMLADAIAPWTTPGFDEIALPAHVERMIDSGRDRVKAWEVDERGELALSGFVHRFAHACLHVCSAFGMTPSYMREAKRGFSTFETRLALAAPSPGAGDGLALQSGLLAVGNSSLRLLHELRNARTGEWLASFHQSGVHFDLEARRSAPLPDAVRTRARALVIT